MIAQALASYASASKKVWLHSRDQTLGASEIGSCARRLVFAKTQDDPDARVAVDDDYVDGWGHKVRGTVYEDHFWVPAMRARFGRSLMFAGDEQRTFVKGYLSGTPDGLLVDQPPDALSYLLFAPMTSTSIVLDCKTFDPRTHLDAPKPEHVFQIIVNMGLIAETTRHDPEYAVLSYTNASAWDDIREFAVRFDPAVYETAKDRARQIMTARHGKDMKPEGVIAGGKECGYCPYTSQCGQIRAGRVPGGNAEADPQTRAHLETLIRLARFADAESDRFDKQARQHKEEIREALEKAGIRQIKGLVGWGHLRGSAQWDDAAIRMAASAAGIDLSLYRKQRDPSDRLTLTLKD